MATRRTPRLLGDRTPRELKIRLNRAQSGIDNGYDNLWRDVLEGYQAGRAIAEDNRERANRKASNVALEDLFRPTNTVNASPLDVENSLISFNPNAGMQVNPQASPISFTQEQLDSILGTGNMFGSAPMIGMSGNIDLEQRPVVRNNDGTVSTVRSMSFNEDGKEILIPTITADGKPMTEQEAIDYYHKTGQNLGSFNTVDEANAAAERIHQSEAQRVNARNIDNNIEVGMLPNGSYYAGDRDKDMLGMRGLIDTEANTVTQTAPTYNTMQDFNQFLQNFKAAGGKDITVAQDLYTTQRENMKQQQDDADLAKAMLMINSTDPNERIEGIKIFGRLNQNPFLSEDRAYELDQRERNQRKDDIQYDNLAMENEARRSGILMPNGNNWPRVATGGGRGSGGGGRSASGGGGYVSNKALKGVSTSAEVSDVIEEYKAKYQDAAAGDKAGAKVSARNGLIGVVRDAARMMYPDNPQMATVYIRQQLGDDLDLAQRAANGYYEMVGLDPNDQIKYLDQLSGAIQGGGDIIPEGYSVGMQGPQMPQGIPQAIQVSGAQEGSTPIFSEGGWGPANERTGFIKELEDSGGIMGWLSGIANKVRG